MASSAERARRDKLTPPEREQLSGQPGGAIGSLENLLHVSATGIVALHRCFEQLSVAPHQRQQVIEVVRDAASQPANRLHFLRLPQLVVAFPGFLYQ